MGYSVPSKDRMPRGPQAEWHSILRGTLYRIGHERSLSNRLRTWSHPRRISFLRGDCIFAFQFFSSHLEITLLFVYDIFSIVHTPMSCNVLLRVLHRAVYRSWCVNSHEPIHRNWGTQGSDCPTRFTRFTLVKVAFNALQPPAPVSGEPAGKAKRPKTSSRSPANAEEQVCPSISIKVWTFLISCKAVK